ncbi:MAG: sulfatase/phosphatase domain-containing protein, partial [Candidatus Sumerlaeota bacterium]
DLEIPEAYCGDWAQGDDVAPSVKRDLEGFKAGGRSFSPDEIRGIRRAFYAMCTHIDHQMRVVIGTLRQEGLLNDTIICFTSDHGDMLGNHGFWAKHWMYEDSANVPMSLKGTGEQATGGGVGCGRVDDRLVGHIDVMPTLLELAGLDVPEHCMGKSMVGDAKNDYCFGMYGHVDRGPRHMVNRMVREPRYKLIYYPYGNALQLFDMENDPHELHDVSDAAESAEIMERMTGVLIDSLKDDEKAEWLTDGKLSGWKPEASTGPHYDGWASGQRGIQWPPPIARKWD